MLEFQPQVREHIGELFGMFGVDSSGFITMAHFVEKVLRPVRPEEGEPPADVTVEPPSWSAAPRPQPARVEMSRVAESSQQQQVELFHQGIRDAQAAQVEEAAARAALPLTLLPALAPYQAPAPAAVTPALSRRSAAAAAASPWDDAESYVARLAELEQVADAHELTIMAARQLSESPLRYGGGAAAAAAPSSSSRRFGEGSVLQSRQAANRRRVQGYGGGDSESDFEEAREIFPDPRYAVSGIATASRRQAERSISPTEERAYSKAQSSLDSLEARLLPMQGGSVTFGDTDSGASRPQQHPLPAPVAMAAVRPAARTPSANGSFAYDPATDEHTMAQISGRLDRCQREHQSSVGLRGGAGAGVDFRQAVNVLQQRLISYSETGWSAAFDETDKSTVESGANSRPHFPSFLPHC